MLYEEHEEGAVLILLLLYLWNNFVETILQHLQFRAWHGSVLPKREPVARFFTFTTLLLMLAPVRLTS